MLVVSEEYKEAMVAPVKSFALRGTIDGETAFDETSVLSGSLSVTNQVSSGDEITLGSVYTAEMKCTFIGTIRSSLAIGSVIALEEGLLVGSTYEYVPIGRYVINAINQTRLGYEVTAYDLMTKFDKRCSFYGTGEAYFFTRLACQQCGVAFGMTEAQVQTFPNGNVNLVLSIDNDITTWRDYIFWIAQALASVAVIDRWGQLQFVPFSATVDDVIDSTQRTTESSFSQFKTRYTSITVDNTDNTQSYYALQQDDGLTYNLGRNPFLQDTAGTVMNLMRYDVLYGLENINYTPFTAEIRAGAIYDLLDVIQFEDGIVGSTPVKGCIMRYEWRYNHGYRMECVGKNPNVGGALSKYDKKISSASKGSGGAETKIFFFLNGADISIGDGETKQILDVRFLANAASSVVFHAEVKLDVETSESGVLYDDAVVTVRYILNNTEMEYHPAETWQDGKHILHLQLNLLPEAGMQHLQVRLAMVGGSADILTAEANGYVMGTGIGDGGGWDGNIEEEEILAPTLLTGQMSVAEIGAESVVSLIEGLPISYTEILSLIELSGLTVPINSATFTGYFSYTAILDGTHYPLYDPTGVELVDGVYRIISGAAVPQIMTMPLIQVGFTVATIANVAMELTNCTFRFSSDGSIWKSYSGGSWQALSAGMTAAQVLALTSSQWLELVTDELHVEITMTDANSTVTSFSLEYTEEI